MNGPSHRQCRAKSNCAKSNCAKSNMEHSSAIRRLPETGHVLGGSHVLPVRVYFEDTDAGGIAYHASYVRFMERGRTELLRVFSLHQSDWLSGPDRLGFVVRRLAIDFIKPAMLDDALTVVTRADEIRGASLHLQQEVRRGEELLVSAVVHVATVRRGRAVRIPDELRSALTNRT